MRIQIPKHLEHRESEIQTLLIKATNNTAKKLLSEHKWVQEYQDAIIKYVEDVIKQVAIGLALKLDINPDKLKKSIRVPIHTLQKAADGKDLGEYELMYKSLFSKLKEKYTIAKNFFKKFGFNKGKPLEPLHIKGKLLYNPETGRPLTKKEWDSLTKQITKFLGDKIGSFEENMIVKAGLMGKLMQTMEKDGIRVEDQKKLSYSDVKKQYGEIPDNVEEAVKQFNLSSPEIASIEYARVHAAEHLSIEDGSLKNQITNMVKQQIVGGLEEGLSAQEMTQRLFWIKISPPVSNSLLEMGYIFSKTMFVGSVMLIISIPLSKFTR